MTTSHRSLRLITFLTTMGLLLLGPVAFGASVSAAEDPSSDVAVTEPLDVLGEVVTDQEGTGEAAGAGSGQGSVGIGEHGDEGTDEEGDHGEESATLVCLATGDRNAPYTAALVMPTAVINGEGRVKKEGPANSPIGIAPADGWGNIVPTLTHPSGATFSGLNFGTDGKTIWEKGCGLDGPATPPDDGHEGGGHGGHATVIVCTATEDSVTPYEVEEWMVQEIINGHGMPKKDGPASNPVEGVFPAEVWGNIIPVVTHPNKKATYPGLNLEDGGQAILDAGCVYVIPAAPAPAPAPAPAAQDFCPDLDGVQWENYDCNTPQAVAVDAITPAAPALVVVAAEPAAAPADVPAPVSAAMPAVVPVPAAETLPTAVDAGGGSPVPHRTPVWAILIIAAGCIGAATSAVRAACSESA